MEQERDAGPCSEPHADAVPWTERIRAGDFSAIPADFSWSTSAKFAHLIDGYALAGGFEPVAALYHRIMEWLETTEHWQASATDLWVAMFGAHRAYRHFGYGPDFADQLLLDELCKMLRSGLQNIGDDERQRLVSHMAEEKNI
jgi:hypothetical protein